MKINERIIESYKEVILEDGTIEKIPVYRVVTRDMTPEEESQYTIPESNEMKIARYKEQLNALDVKFMKAQEKVALQDENASEELLQVIAEKKALRDQINELEKKVNN